MANSAFGIELVHLCKRIRMDWGGGGAVRASVSCLGIGLTNGMVGLFVGFVENLLALDHGTLVGRTP